MYYLQISQLLKKDKVIYRALRPLMPLAKNIYKNYWLSFVMKMFRRKIAKISSRTDSPFFVKFGACDGIIGDPCSDILLAGDKWAGVLIEPVKENCKRLRENFYDHSRFMIINGAIGEKRGICRFYYVGEGAKKNLKIYHHIGTR